MKSETTKKLTRTAILLAIMLISVYFKNISPLITGPIVNAVLIIATLSVGFWGGAALSLIAPLAAFLYGGAQPVYTATNYTLFPAVMLGNLAIVLMVWLFTRKDKSGKFLVFGLAAGCVTKWLVMWGIVDFFVVNYAANAQIVAKLDAVFTHFQLLTSAMGSVLAYLIWLVLRKALKSKE